MAVAVAALLALLCRYSMRRRRYNDNDKVFEKIASGSFARDTYDLGYTTEPAHQANNKAYGDFDVNTYVRDPQAHNAYASEAQAYTAYTTDQDSYANDAYAAASTGHGHSTNYTHAAVEDGLQYPPGTAFTTQELQNQYAAATTRSYTNHFFPRGAIHATA